MLDVDQLSRQIAALDLDPGLVIAEFAAGLATTLVSLTLTALALTAAWTADEGRRRGALDALALMKRPSTFLKTRSARAPHEQPSTSHDALAWRPKDRKRKTTDSRARVARLARPRSAQPAVRKARTRRPPEGNQDTGPSSSASN